MKANGIHMTRTVRPLRELAALVVLLSFSASGQPAVGLHGAVATVDGIASQAGIDAMKKGGNAVDAAIAAALTLGVVNGYNSGIGGGCFILVRLASGEIVCVDGRETAPAAATHDMYLSKRGLLHKRKVIPGLSETGALAIATPGALAAYELAVKSWGKIPFKEHLLAAAEMAETGFRIDKQYARHLREDATDLAKYPATRAVFIKPDGTPWGEGEILRQTDLARTYRAIAEHGLEWFYDGPFGQAVEKWMKENQGLVTTADLKGYRPVLRAPVATEYRGYTVISFPPPSSGGVHILEVLNMLESHNISNFTEADRDHLIAESMKLVFADRAFWLGDPDFVKVPRGLTSKDYARARAARIDLKHATPVRGPGTPSGSGIDLFSKHTTHLSTVDAGGNWVALTTTINTHFGSKVVIPGTGVIMNNQMDDFSAQPGVPNYFGLVGGEANAIAPGKRPLSSMSPTIVLKGRDPILALGAAGGPTIISQTLLSIVNVLDLGMDAQTAINQPKFHHQWRPDELKVEEALNPAVQSDLATRGHAVRPIKWLGATQAVGLAPDGQGFLSAADPRANGAALAW
jgi:gamma-glutamyltranspeptidase/glutathione hydrolase